MKNIFLILLIIVSSISYSQKIKGEYDKTSDIVSVNGKQLFKVVPKGVSGQLTNNHFSIQNLNDEELIYLKFNSKTSYSNGKKINKVWYDLLFIKTGNIVRKIKSGTMGAKGAMKFILKNELIKNDQVDSNSEKKIML